MRFEQALTLDGIAYRYPEQEGLALNGVSLTIRPGESVGFAGLSGAGKSTLVDCLLGLLELRSGEIRVDGERVTGNLRAWQRLLGYVPQEPTIIDESLRRNVAFGLSDGDIDDEAVMKAITAAHLDTFVTGLPQGLDTLLGENGARMSGGERQRVAIARALYHDPAILVLDEATSALDLETEAGVMQAIEALHGSKTLIIVAHRLSTLENCDRLFEVRAGEVREIDRDALSRLFAAGNGSPGSQEQGRAAGELRTKPID